MFGLRDVNGLFLFQLIAEGTLSQMETVGNAGRTTKEIIDYYPLKHSVVQNTGLHIMQIYENCSVAVLKSNTFLTKQKSNIGSNF